MVFFLLIIRCGRDYCDAKELMDIADAMVENGMKDVGFEYINMDGQLTYQTPLVNFEFEYVDCWADHRADDGTIVPDKNRFPE